MDEHAAPPPGRTRLRMFLSALRLVACCGADALTTRRLGQAVGPGPMALYRYAENPTALVHGVAETALAHPLAARLGPRPLWALRPLEQNLPLLACAAFAPDHAQHAYRARFGLVHSRVLHGFQEILVDPEATDALIRPCPGRLAPGEFPRNRSVVDAVLAGCDVKAELDGGLDLSLDGLLRTERPTAQCQGRV